MLIDCPCCGAVHPKNSACLPPATKFEVHKVPVPIWMNKSQQGAFASKHIAARKGDTQSRREIDEIFIMLIAGYEFVNELQEEKQS